MSFVFHLREKWAVLEEIMANNDFGQFRSLNFVYSTSDIPFLSLLRTI